ncbi:hypothetical protein [Cupriavidus campinensis]
MTTQQLLTPHQSQYFAWLLTRRAAGDSVESLASTLVDSQVDLNPHQVDAALFACRNPVQLKPAKGQFQIFYKLSTEQPEYIPDFVAETDTIIFMVETKARGEINAQDVQAKAAAASRWCKHASDHATSVGTKPWKYLLVPHDEIIESKRLADFLRFEIKA